MDHQSEVIFRQIPPVTGEALLYLTSGCVFGLAAGFSPGPMTTVVITQALRYGFADGIKVALAPLLTDGLIITLALVLIGQLSWLKPLLGGITLLGAAFLIYLAIENFKVRRIELPEEQVEPHSFWKGVVANLLNPHPYLFWVTIGAPTFLKAVGISVLASILFIIGFYLCLIGSKILIAWLVARSRSFPGSQAYVYINRLLGFALVAFALLFLRDGFGYLAPRS